MNQTVISPETFRMYIAEAETAYEAQLSAAVSEILGCPDVQIVTVTGPTCSGKTTTSKKLTEALEDAGHPVYMVSFDDFFKNREDLPKTASGGTDYDSAASLDLPKLNDCLDRLVRGETCELPKFDFETGRRTGYETYLPRENDIILLEGIQAMYPEVREHLPHDIVRSIAICPQRDVPVSGGRVITAREIRLLRRLVRDARVRNSDAAKTLSMWADVCKNENENILPYLCGADILIDSFLAYELHVIRPCAETVLAALPGDSVFRPMADDLLDRLSAFPPMPADGVPRDSVFREFIGQCPNTK
ncbi:MAG: nucleoside kinase [Clostridia bacterium]|nr:nucleoside kinase [Clostridia bacterium]